MNLTARASTLLKNAATIRAKSQGIGNDIRVLIAMLKGDGGIGSCALKMHSISMRRLNAFLREGELSPISDEAVKIESWLSSSGYLDAAEQEARELQHQSIGCEHLFLALLRPQRRHVAAFFYDVGLEARELRRDVFKMLGCEDRRAQTAGLIP